MRRFEVDEQGHVRYLGAKKGPPIDIPWELRAVLLRLMQAAVMLGAAVQLRWYLH
jgi:hypothetical protein